MCCSTHSALHRAHLLSTRLGPLVLIPKWARMPSRLQVTMQRQPPCLACLFGGCGAPCTHPALAVVCLKRVAIAAAVLGI
jgi:hypothetical protein